MTDVFEDCRRMVAAVAPEMPAPYLFDSVDLPLPIARCLAWTVDGGVDAQLWQVLVERGEWRGARPMIVLNVDRIAADAAAANVDRREAILQVFAHEIAHHLPYFAPPDAVPASAEIERQKGEFAKWAAAGRPADLPPWSGHGRWFIRAALHVHHRATKAGFAFPLGGLAAGVDYGLWHIEHYRAALGDEPTRLENKLFSSIEETKAPAHFIRLFEDDCERYQERNLA